MHAQCEFDGKIIWYILLVVAVILLLCCCCCLFPLVVEAGATAAKTGEEAAEGAVGFLKKALYYSLYGLKCIWHVLGYLAPVLFLPFLVVVCFSLMVANLMRIATEKLAKFLDKRIATDALTSAARAPRMPSVISKIIGIASDRARAVLQNVTDRVGLRHRGAWQAIKERKDRLPSRRR